jgi:FtsZ-binding cell division protein ZapB
MDNTSLSSFIHNIETNLTKLQKEVDELKQENAELKDVLTHAHHQWWLNTKKSEQLKPTDNVNNATTKDHCQIRS